MDPTLAGPDEDAFPRNRDSVGVGEVAGRVDLAAIDPLNRCLGVQVTQRSRPLIAEADRSSGRDGIGGTEARLVVANLFEVPHKRTVRLENAGQCYLL